MPQALLVCKVCKKKFRKTKGKLVQDICGQKCARDHLRGGKSRPPARDLSKAPEDHDGATHCFWCKAAGSYCGHKGEFETVEIEES